MEEQTEYCKEICIYCMGEYGIKLCYALMESGYSVSCFGDADESKKGYGILGVPCISYEQVCGLDRNRFLIAVAKRNPEKLIRNFKEQGFKEVYSDKELIGRLETKGEKCKGQSRLDNIEVIRSILDRLKNACYQENLLYQDEESFYLPFPLKEDIQYLLKDCILRKLYECG